MTVVRITFQLLLFLATFVLEVRVKASTHEEPAAVKQEAHAPAKKVEVLVQQEPFECLKTKAACAIKTREGQSFELELDSKTSIVLDHSSALIRISNNEIRLVSGSVWVKAQETFKVKTEFGDLVSSTPGEFWVTRTKERVTAKATEATVQLLPRGSQDRLILDSGLQNYIGSIGLDGKAETGVPLAIPFKDHVIQWARVYRGPKKDFEEKLEAFHGRWKQATVESAEINKALYTRMVSSADEEKAATDAHEAKVQAEREANRKFFRSRVFDGL